MSNILPFPRAKRGRPKVRRAETDFGTPELQQKRYTSETVEPFDLCLQKGLITPEQHWCGIHLRWLYTLRYGAPGVRALDINHVNGLELESDDPDWSSAREAEYHDALRRLTLKGYAALLMNICIHNERPDFLDARHKKLSQNDTCLEKLRDGLDILVKHWDRVKRA